MIIGFLLWSACTLLFLGFAVYARRSQQAVGFWANVKAPEVSDVKEYNRAVSNLWLIGAFVFELLGLPLLLAHQNSPLFMISILGTVMLVLGMMIRYSFIEGRYRK